MIRNVPITAGVVPVIVILRDIATGATVTEHPLNPGETMTFAITDGVELVSEEWDGSRRALAERYDPIKAAETPS